MDSKVKVKAKFKGMCRRFESPSSITWDEMCAQLFSLFDVGEDFRLQYCDDENELVLISSQEELEEAIKVTKKKKGLLSLYIEDSTSGETNATSLLNLDNQNANQANKKGKRSNYVALASSIAPAFNAMNARLEQSKCNENSNQTKVQVDNIVGEEKQSQTPEAPSVSMQEETANCYVKLTEVMAMSKKQTKREGEDDSIDFESANLDQERVVLSFEQEPPSNPPNGISNKMENEKSRGWFNYNEDQKQQQQPPPLQQYDRSRIKESKMKKKGCYNELASIMAPRLANLHVPEPQNDSREGSVACESDDTDLSDTSQAGSVSACKLPPEISGDNAIKPSDCNQQQTNYGKQHRKVKRPKRSKKHNRKKGCYAQAALDMSPLFAAMNKRMEEIQWQQNTQEAVSLNDEDEELDSDKSDSSFESFVFVEPEDDMSSGDQAAAGHSSLPTEKKMDLYQVVDKEIHVDNGEDQNDLNEHVVIQEVLNKSLDNTVEENVQLMQQMNLSQSSTSNQIPNEMLTSTDPEDTTKVLHKGITCDSCQNQIQGIRYKCCNCRDFDLCESCESKDGIHDLEHVFLKLKFQAPGIGRKHGEMVPIFRKPVYKKTQEEKQKEKQQKSTKEAEKEKKRKAIKESKCALKAQEKEKREEKRKEKREMNFIKKEIRQEIKKFDQQRTNPRAIKMARVYQKLKMEYVHNITYPDGSVVSPGEKFLKTWVIKNAGTIAWNQWIKMECFEGDIMVNPGKSHAVVPHLKPGMQGEVSVEFIAPELPGLYSSKWHLSYGLYSFGPYLCCQIEVRKTPDNNAQTQYDQSGLADSASAKGTPAVPNLTFVEDTKIQAASYLLRDDDSASECHSSEETPKTNQGGELITTSERPLLSLETQQRQDLEWDAGCVHDVEVLDTSTDSRDSQSRQSIFSGNEDMRSGCTSEDSDDEDDGDSSFEEITVLIPPCFIPDTPLSADPVAVKVECLKRSDSFTFPSHRSAFESYLNLDDSESERASILPTVHSLERRLSSIENVAIRSADEPVKETSVPVNAHDVAIITNDGGSTPSGRFSPSEAGVRTQPEAPVSRKDGESLQDSRPSTITHNNRSCDARKCDQSPLPSNVVSDVISSAIDVVANAGRAAIARVDNIINGTVQPNAVYKPEDDCLVTLGRQTNPSCNDKSSPLVLGNNPMEHLIEMGFGDRRLNQQLLRKHNNDIRATVEELLNHTENEWSSQRH